MKHQIFGYARVSSKDQNASRQVEALRNYPVEEENIYLEKKSGKDFNRPEYQRLLCALRDGDILVIKSIDRLGRNYDETLEQWRVITKEKNVNVVVLDMPILNSYHDGDLTRKLISDIVLQLLIYVAQQEREFIHQRQTEGIAIAKNKGGKATCYAGNCGRPEKFPRDAPRISLACAIKRFCGGPGKTGEAITMLQGQIKYFTILPYVKKGKL